MSPRRVFCIVLSFFADNFARTIETGSTTHIHMVG